MIFVSGPAMSIAISIAAIVPPEGAAVVDIDNGIAGSAIHIAKMEHVGLRKVDEDIPIRVGQEVQEKRAPLLSSNGNSWCR